MKIKNAKHHATKIQGKFEKNKTTKQNINKIKDMFKRRVLPNLSRLSILFAALYEIKFDKKGISLIKIIFHFKNYWLVDPRISKIFNIKSL